MLLLETKLGDYLLHNATRLDVYTTEEKETWVVHLRIDGSGQAILGFDSQSDALIFRALVRAILLDNLCEPRGREWKRLTMEDICQLALHKLTTKDLI